MLQTRRTMRKALRLLHPCAKFGILVGTCFLDTARENAASWKNGAPASPRIKVILEGVYGDRERAGRGQFSGTEGRVVQGIRARRGSPVCENLRNSCAEMPQIATSERRDV